MELTTAQVLKQGLTAHKEGKLQDAERLYRTILQSQPLHPDANHNLGLLAVSSNNPEAALPFFKTALEAQPNLEQFWLSYVGTLIKCNQHETGRKVVEQAKQRGLASEKLNSLERELIPVAGTDGADSKNPPANQLNYLLKLYQQKQYEEAERLARAITQEFPAHQFGWKVLGGVFKQTRRPNDALVVIKKSVEVAPYDAEAHYNLGTMLQELRKFDDAKLSYSQAISLRPDYVEAHSNLGLCLQELGCLSKAEASYKQAISFNPNYTEAFYNLGITLKELERLDEAAASFKQAISLNRSHAQAYSNLGVTLHALGKPDEAEGHFKQAISLNPNYAEAHYNLGITLRELAKLEQAKLSFKKAIELKPDFRQAHSGLGVLLLRTGHHQEGLHEILQGEGFIYFDLNNGMSIS